MKFKFPYGDTKLTSPFLANTPAGDNATSRFDTLILDAMYNYSWAHANPIQRDYARFVTDQVTADLQNLASGNGEAPHGKFMHLYLNGLYWGLYNVHERPDDSFAAEYYGGNKDDYYVVKHANQDIDHEYTWVEGGISAEQSYNELLEAARVVSSAPTNSANYQAVQDLLDVDQYIDYLLVHYYAGGKADWSHNNWYATFNHVDPSGKWRFHAWDQEHAFPTTDNGDSFNEDADLTLKDDFEAPTEIHQNLIGNEEYRLRFSDRVQELMHNGGALTDAVAQSVYQARVDEITSAIIGESARWGDNRNYNDPYAQADFLNTSNNLLTAFFGPHGSFPGRNAEVLGQFEGISHDEPGNNNDWLVSLAAPQFSQYGGQISAGFLLSLTKPSGSPGGATIYYTLDGSDPRRAGGGINPTATAYTEPLLLNDATRVQARIFFDSAGTAEDWSAVVDKAFVLEESFPVRIVELYYHPASYPGVVDEEDMEFIELLNISDSSVNLAGVQITGAVDTYTFDNSVDLAAGERIVVARNRGVFEQVYGTQINLAPGDYDGKLNNAGELVILLGPFGETLQNFFYDDEGAWPAAADGDGYSLEYVGPLDGQEDPLGTGDPFDDAANWRASQQYLGSPGTDGVLVIDPDFNDDGFINGVDIDLLQANIVTGPANAGAYDLNGDGLVTVTDRDEWLVQAGAVNLPSGNPYRLGDANLDGFVDTSDFNVWNANKFTVSSAWTSGDFSLDGSVDTSDFNLWNASKFTSSDAVNRLAVDDNEKYESTTDVLIEELVMSDELIVAQEIAAWIQPTTALGTNRLVTIRCGQPIHEEPSELDQLFATYW